MDKMDNLKQEFKCKCCDGKGIQKRSDGINIICPCCNGGGDDRKVNENIKWPPINPHGQVYC